MCYLFQTDFVTMKVRISFIQTKKIAGILFLKDTDYS